jgi:soluble lytic murein transglycosylase
MALLVILASGCEQRPPATAQGADAGPVFAAAGDAGELPGERSWADLVRQDRFAEAARVVDALPEPARATVELRYLRARLALELGDGATALRLLEGLDTALPLLAPDVLERRADAEFAAGRFKDAGEHHAARPGSLAQLKASRAFERALDAVRARGAADRVVQSNKATRGQEAEARARRLRLGGRTVREDAEDARWLAVEAPDLHDSEGALARLAALERDKPLTFPESVKRARLLADAGQVDEAIKTLEAVPGPTPTTAARLERLRAKADVYFRSRFHALLAARTFDECVNLAGPTALEDAFKAARSLSRADRDDEAIDRFLTLSRRAPKSPWGEEALFLAARLHLLHGRFPQAAALLDEHQQKHTNTRKEAARLRALAYFMAGRYSRAVQLFEELSDDEKEPLAAARARTMAALAALKNGDRTLSIARWSEVARSRPLSWPALVARSRLAEIKAPLPPTFEAAPPDGPPAEPLSFTLPPPVDFLHRIGLDEDAEAALRDREAAVTAIAPGRSTEALCTAYGMLGRAKRRYQIAQQIPQAMLFSAPTPRTRWAWDCAFPAPFGSEVRDEETKLGLPTGLVFAIMRQESGFDPDATSPARAIGLMQLLPETGKTVAGQLSLPFEENQLSMPLVNVRLGARYVHDLVDKFRGNVPLALAGYNGGPDNITKWMGRLKDVPLDVFVEHVPFAETRAYVVRVMGNLARYAYLRGGEGSVPMLALAPLDAAP